MLAGDGTEWILEGGDGQTLTLEDGRAHGSGGVNRFAGEYTIDGDRLALGPLAATRMAGPPEANRAELAFFAALERAARVTVAGGRLVLADADGAELLRFVPAQAAQAAQPAQPAQPTQPEEDRPPWS
jgi:heat shock protein HslJ